MCLCVLRVYRWSSTCIDVGGEDSLLCGTEQSDWDNIRHRVCLALFPCTWRELLSSGLLSYRSFSGARAQSSLSSLSFFPVSVYPGNTLLLLDACTDVPNTLGLLWRVSCMRVCVRGGAAPSPPRGSLSVFEFLPLLPFLLCSSLSRVFSDFFSCIISVHFCCPCSHTSTRQAKEASWERATALVFLSLLLLLLLLPSPLHPPLVRLPLSSYFFVPSSLLSLLQLLSPLLLYSCLSL